MPNVTPAGPLTVAIDALSTLISNVPFFQTWTSSANASQALAHIFEGEVGYPISSVSITSNVLTVNTREPHNLTASQSVTIEGASTGGEGLNIDGAYTVVATPTATSFTVSKTASDLADTRVDLAFVVPCARPIAVLCEPDESVRATSIGTGGTSVFAGTIEILLEADVSTSYKNDNLNALNEARNAFGQFVQGLADLQETADFMVLNEVTPIKGPEFTNNSEQDDNTARFERWRAVARVTWGVNA